MDKRGAVDWTIGRLLSLVLLVIVLLLVVYGVSTGGLNPLIEKAGGMIDEVLIFLNIKEDSFGDDDCFEQKISSVSEGDILSDLLEIKEEEQENLMLSVCKDSVCTINGGNLGDYRVKEGVFEKKGAALFFYEEEFYKKPNKIYYRFKDSWEWSVDLRYWMSVNEYSVKEGEYSGEEPIVGKFRDLNNLLEKEGELSFGEAKGLAFEKIVSSGEEASEFSDKFKEASFESYDSFIEGSLSEAKLNQGTSGLTDEEFKEAYGATAVRNFLLSKCA